MVFGFCENVWLVFFIIMGRCEDIRILIIVINYSLLE